MEVVIHAPGLTLGAGYKTAMIGSWEPESKAISNYHLPSDTPDKLRYATIERAVDIAEGLVHELASA